MVQIQTDGPDHRCTNSNFIGNNDNEKVTYLPHNTGVDWLDADVLRVKIESVHKRLSWPDQFIILSSSRHHPESSSQIHSLCCLLLVHQCYHSMCAVSQSLSSGGLQLSRTLVTVSTHINLIATCFSSLVDIWSQITWRRCGVMDQWQGKWDTPEIKVNSFYLIFLLIL